MPEVLREIRDALALEADEIDLVFPCRAFLEGDSSFAASLVSAAARDIHEAGRILKVILEIAAFESPARITEAGLPAIDSGADFLKAQFYFDVENRECCRTEAGWFLV